VGDEGRLKAQRPVATPALAHPVRRKIPTNGINPDLLDFDLLFFITYIILFPFF
jgi:hypothetical protein